jgi:hypothetical protein
MIDLRTILTSNNWYFTHPIDGLPEGTRVSFRGVYSSRNRSIDVRIEELPAGSPANLRDNIGNTFRVSPESLSLKEIKSLNNYIKFSIVDSVYDEYFKTDIPYIFLDRLTDKIIFSNTALSILDIDKNKKESISLFIHENKVVLSKDLENEGHFSIENGVIKNKKLLQSIYNFYNDNLTSFHPVYYELSYRKSILANIGICFEINISNFSMNFPKNEEIIDPKTQQIMIEEEQRVREILESLSHDNVEF